MSGCLVLLSIAVLVCQVHSQFCSPPILPPPCPAPSIPLPCQPAIPPCAVNAPQVINPNPYVTTIIDNSVSNALVNALQLLIVSNLIGSTIGPSAPLLNNLGPLLDSLVCSNPCSIDLGIPDFVSCGPNYDLISYGGPILTCGSQYDIIPACGPSYELIPPCGPIIDPYLTPLCGLSDIYPNFFTYTETVTPICFDNLPYNGYGELLFPLPGLETVCPNLCNGVTEVIPNYISYPDISPCLNPYGGGYVETIAPIAPFPNMFGCLNEVVPQCLPPPASYVPESPYGSLIVPSYCGGLTELSAPCAEVLLSPLPSTIPAPVTCSYGYSPSSLPCVRANMEPSVYDNCICSGYSGPIYY